MNFTDIFIRRPVFSSALSLMLLLLGLVSFASLTVRQYPNIAANVVTITTNYPGANPDLMAGFVTTPLENAIGGIDNIDYMYSSSVEGQSVITVYLKLDGSIDSALANTMAKVTSVMYQLPPDVQQPIVAKSDSSSPPTVYINFASDTMTSEAITDYLIRVVQPQLNTLNGVSSSTIYGEREYAMRLQLNPELMAGLNVTPAEVYNQMVNQNIQTAAGAVLSKYQTANVVVNTDLQSVPQFDNMVMYSNNDTLVKLKDIGKAQLAAKDYTTSAVVNGKESVVIGITPKSNANPLAVSQEVNELLPEISKELPQGMTTKVIYDQSIFIQASIDEVYDTIAEAVLFVIAVMLLFLGSFRAVIVPIVTIPLSVIGVCSYMLAMGYTINTITLLAWVLAIGLVVDDAIVVVENIYRHIGLGKTPFKAAIDGTREIGFAIIAMTLTLAAVYAPIGFTGGITGVLFGEFAFTLAGAVIFSGFIALTLSPMMCSKLLTNQHSKWALFVDKTFDNFKEKYRKILREVLHMRWFVVGGAAIIYVLFYVIYSHTPSTLAPTEDEGVLFTFIQGPSSANIKFTEKYTSQLTQIYNSVPEKENFVIINGFSGVNTGIAVIALIDWDKRTRTTSEISKSLFPKMWGIQGLKVIPFPPAPLPDAGLLPISFVLKSTKANPTMELYNNITKLKKAAENNAGFEGVNVDLMIDAPQINITINRNMAGLLGVSMTEISQALIVLLGQPQQNQFSMDQRSYFVIPEFDKNFDYQNNPELLNSVYVRTSSGKTVPLSNLVTITKTVQPLSINHFQQLPSATLTAANTPGFTLGQDLAFLKDYTEKNLSKDLQIDYSGQARQLIEASDAMEQALVFAIIFIFLVLAAQFESYRDPIIVMTTVPLSLTGAMFTLHLIGGSLNIYTQIGLITLIGLISKHGILIVEFANELQIKEKLSVWDAVIESTSVRLRPILMTTAAMVLGALPLALASGAGAVSRHQLGWVIVGGMTLGTVFSLFVVPSVYTLIAKKKEALPGEE